jgi:AcrR family transcriptional regulator
MTAQSRPKPDAKTDLLEAAKRVLLKHGYAGLSTRAVAAEAGTQMSQIRYHFGSKEGMVLALFEYMNAALIERQAATFHRTDLSISLKWARACDYLEEDLASGYVRVLQELSAVGWSSPAASRRNVLLPHPEPPTTATISPSSTSRLSPASARVPFG